VKTIKDFIRILDRHTFLITILSLLSTGLCRYFDFRVDIPTELIGIAVIFPLVFSISGAYKQREDVLAAFASLRAHAIALYYAHRDWPRETTLKKSGSKLVERLFHALVKYFRNPPDGPEGKANLREVYTVFSAFSENHERLRQVGVPAYEISRANQFLSMIMADFERMNNVAHYRPPVSLRAHSRMFLNLFPIIFGPYFANLSYPEYPWVGYGIAALYAIVLVSLDNVSDQLENPFDNIGPDDLRLEVVEDYIEFLQPEQERA